MSSLILILLSVYLSLPLRPSLSPPFFCSFASHFDNCSCFLPFFATPLTNLVPLSFSHSECEADTSFDSIKLFIFTDQVVLSLHSSGRARKSAFTTVCGMSGLSEEVQSFRRRFGVDVTFRGGFGVGCHLTALWVRPKNLPCGFSRCSVH